MNPFVASQLQPHPEGGRFREVFRSPVKVTDSHGQSKSALTHIYFALGPDGHSCFHRVEQDEIWNLYRGDGLRLWILNPDTLEITLHILAADENCFCAVVPAGHWQATESMGTDILVGCSVAPGFDFADFQIMSPTHPLAATVRQAELTHLLGSS